MPRMSYSRRVSSGSSPQQQDVLLEEGMRLVSLLPESPNHATNTPPPASPASSSRTASSSSRHHAGDRAFVDYSSLTVNRLRQELKNRGLSQKGVKRELITRLQECDTTMAAGKVRGRKKADATDLNGDMQVTAPPSGLTPHQKLAIQKERMSLVLWRRPLMTFYYFLLEFVALFQEFLEKLWKNLKLVILCLFAFLTLVVLYYVDGPHQSFVAQSRTQIIWCAYWVGLGILSSVGLGTGLHTFILYLGPHIASVTLAAFECMSVDFPEPPYPKDIVCPEVEGTSMSLWTIMSKVRIESFMWGAGTALGELPPYFMARAARLSGQIDDEEQELEELIHEKEKHSKLSFMDRSKVAVHDLVKKVGFMGILLCASIPNPLFDLAGITCGHFLVPFWTFFGATLIGKAVIKMHIQKLFVIFMFSEKHVEHVVQLIEYLPYGQSLQAPFKEYLNKQKEKLHTKGGEQFQGQNSWLSWIFEKLILTMVVYFVVSIVNSMAQHYHKRSMKSRKLEKVSHE